MDIISDNQLLTKSNDKNILIQFKLSQANKTNWYVFYTCPRAEKIVYQELLKREYDAYLPLIKTIRIWKNRQKKKIELPLFPNYIFVNTQRAELYNIVKLPKVATYISCGNTPSIIREKDIEIIRKMLTYGQSISINSEFTEGDKVRIIHGPLIGHEGILIKQKGKTRFGIKLKEINQSVFVDICVSSIEKLV